jgi:hypothetical protein
MGLFVLAMVFYLKLRETMWLAIWFLPHFFRGILGYFINKGFPRSHHVLKDLDFGEGQDHLNFDKAQKSVRASVQKVFFAIFEDQKNNLKAYLWLTILSLILDIVCFFIVLKHFGVPGEEDNEMILIMMSCIYGMCNLYWIHWSLTLKHRLPEYMSVYLKDAALGVGSHIAKAARNTGSYALEAVKELPRSTLPMSVDDVTEPRRREN